MQQPKQYTGSVSIISRNSRSSAGSLPEAGAVSGETAFEAERSESVLFPYARSIFRRARRFRGRGSRSTL